MNSCQSNCKMVAKRPRVDKMDGVLSYPGALGVEIMKTVISEVPTHVWECRKRTGADQWDEMWEGVLHMPPAPNRSHQALEGALERWLWTNWAEPLEAEVYHQINIASTGGWPNSYRIPDLVLLLPDRFDIDRNEYFEGAPTVVVEIHSPGDETFEKFRFYAELGVPEVWIVDRDTKLPEIYLLKDGEYRKQDSDEDGWISSEITGILLRGEPNAKLAIQLAADPETRTELPKR
jgi:hypothetical protein